MYVPSMVVAIWGHEKTWKSTLALSFPKPLIHFDMDVGGFDRAAWRMDVSGVISKPYPTPVQMNKLMGATKVAGANAEVTIRFPKKITGIKEVWQQFVMDFVACCQNPEVKTMVIDSATQTWNIDHRGYLQELQERQIAKEPAVARDENLLRERLQSIEYGEPNDRMRTMIYTARSYGKNLILTHYPTDIYADMPNQKGEIQSYKTGALKLDGFKETERLVDMVILTTTQKNSTTQADEIVAKITRCALPGMGTPATGLLLPTVDYAGIIELREMLMGGAKT